MSARLSPHDIQNLTFHPEDRQTGSQLTSEQLKACKRCHDEIKDCLYSFENNLSVHFQWTRRKLRCPTPELLSLSERVLGEAQWRKERLSTQAWAGGSCGIISLKKDIQFSEEVDESDLAALTPEQFYQFANNIRHELISRFAVDSHHRRAISNPLIDMTPMCMSGAAEKDIIQNTHDTGSTSKGLELSSSAPELLHQPKTNLTDLSETMKIAEDSKLESQESSSKLDTERWAIEYMRGSLPQATAEDRTVGSPVESMPALEEDLQFSMDNLHFSTGRSPENHYSQRHIFNDGSDNLVSLSRTNSEKIEDEDLPLGSAGSPAPRQIHHRSNGGIRIMTRIKPQKRPGHRAVNFISPSGSGFRTPHSQLSGESMYHSMREGTSEGEIGLYKAGFRYTSVPQINLLSNISLTIPFFSRVSSWNHYLRSRGLIPDPFHEMDWSGRGQHAEFNHDEFPQIPLVTERILGHSRTAVVESVRCKRIRLARKTVKCDRRLRKEDAISEVEHLQRLGHPHIIRVVGTYIFGKDLAILLYPVAEFTLDSFLESTYDDDILPEDQSVRLISVSNFLRCLAKGLSFIHSKAMKHMDIKPKNLLVRDMRQSIVCNQGMYKIYIADFGIARSYRSALEAETETPTPYTRTYAAPEVVMQEKRDMSADIFSLGCVYTEVLAVLAQRNSGQRSHADQLDELRSTNNDGDESFQANSERIQGWLAKLTLSSYGFEPQLRSHRIANLIAKMLCINPSDRPSAQTVVDAFPYLNFCCDVNGGAEPFEAAERSTATRSLYDRDLSVLEKSRRFYRCSIEGCVKLYPVQDLLKFHEEVCSPYQYTLPELKILICIVRTWRDDK